MGNQGSALNDDYPGDQPGRNLHHFDHNFKGAIHTLKGSFVSEPFGGPCAKESRPVDIVCKGSTFEIIEEQGVRALYRLSVQYSEIEFTEWDHATSAVKLSCKRENSAGEIDIGEIILELAVSVEFEQELRLRFVNMLQINPDAKFPSVMYVGMFAGSTKPKPFQRKRPNLSHLATGKLPSLHDMRDMAIEAHRGAYQPCRPGKSRRLELAIEHVHTGYNTFQVNFLQGPNRVTSQWRQGEALVELRSNMITLHASRFAAQEDILYDDIKEWDAVDNDGVRTNGSGIKIHFKNDSEPITIGVQYVRDIKHTLEFFWNCWLTDNSKAPKLGSTHGRPLRTVSTLSGEEPAGEPPLGSSEVVDLDGQVVKTGMRMADRKTFMSDFMGNSEPKFAPSENPSVRGHWDHVVMHQGWLLKKGGIGLGQVKNWIKRYFVLYATSQGHFLVYYSDFTESPAYTNDQNHRNIVDLAKACFIRPGSTAGDDTPPHSFDIVTTEREWTLCAESRDNVQKWLKLITRAVDEDVAILPDEEVCFNVKAKEDPLETLNPNDYNTCLKLSAQGVSVTTKDGDRDREHHFWVYTDFYKWSNLRQNGKLALLVTVYTDSSFSRRHEFVFRHKEAVRLSTAIEYFIEKFMSVMHIRLESLPSTEIEADSAQTVNGTSIGAGDDNGGGIMNANADLLDLLDSPTYTTPSVPVTTASVVPGFGFDMPSAPAPPTPASSAPSDPTSVHKNPFQNDDPFDMLASAPPPVPIPMDPFGSMGGSPMTPTTVPISPQQSEQHKAWRLNVLMNGSGPMYDDGSLQIAIKVEIRGSQGRITLSFRNKSAGAISGLQATLVDPGALLRTQADAVTPTISAGATAQIVVMVECMKPGSETLSLSVKYSEASGSQHDNTVELPLVMCSFNEALQLSAEQFEAKWQMLVGGGREMSETIVPTKTLQLAQISHAFEKAMKLGNIPATAQGMVIGAASLKTGTLTERNEKISIGCLVRLQLDQMSGVATVAVRTLHPAATAATMETIKSILFK